MSGAESAAAGAIALGAAGAALGGGAEGRDGADGGRGGADGSTHGSTSGEHGGFAGGFHGRGLGGHDGGLAHMAAQAHMVAAAAQRMAALVLTAAILPFTQAPRPHPQLGKQVQAILAGSMLRVQMVSLMQGSPVKDLLKQWRKQQRKLKQICKHRLRHMNAAILKEHMREQMLCYQWARESMPKMLLSMVMVRKDLPDLEAVLKVQLAPLALALVRRTGAEVLDPMAAASPMPV